MLFFTPSDLPYHQWSIGVMCTGWNGVSWNDVMLESHWINQSCLCVSAAGHRGQWHPEWSTGQAEQRPGWAEQHLWKHVSVYISYTHTHVWIKRKWTDWLLHWHFFSTFSPFLFSSGQTFNFSKKTIIILLL